MRQNGISKEIEMSATLPRITARVDNKTQELLAQAAAISGVSSINSFVVSAAVEKAKNIMERERSLTLSHDDAMILVNALDKNGQVNSRLQQAASRYDKKIQA
jgi:uncharacterized protein (DUF1778 family)